MIFNNAEALLNQLPSRELVEIGIEVLEDGTIEGLPHFPFAYKVEAATGGDDDWKDAILPSGNYLNPIPMLMANIDRSRG